MSEMLRSSDVLRSPARQANSIMTSSLWKRALRGSAVEEMTLRGPPHPPCPTSELAARESRLNAWLVRLRLCLA